MYDWLTCYTGSSTHRTFLLKSIFPSSQKEHESWTHTHSWQSWREHYVKNCDSFDELVDEYIKDHESDATKGKQRATELLSDENESASDAAPKKGILKRKTTRNDGRESKRKRVDAESSQEVGGSRLSEKARGKLKQVAVAQKEEQEETGEGEEGKIEGEDEEEVAGDGQEQHGDGDDALEERDQREHRQQMQENHRSKAIEVDQIPEADATVVPDARPLKEQRSSAEKELSGDRDENMNGETESPQIYGNEIFSNDEREKEDSSSPEDDNSADAVEKMVSEPEDPEDEVDELDPYVYFLFATNIPTDKTVKSTRGTSVRRRRIATNIYYSSYAGETIPTTSIAHVLSPLLPRQPLPHGLYSPRLPTDPTNSVRCDTVPQHPSFDGHAQSSRTN